MEKTESTARKLEDPLHTLIISAASIYFTIAIVLVYITNSDHPFSFLYNNNNSTEISNYISKTKTKLIDNEQPPIGLIAKYIIKNNSDIDNQEHLAQDPIIPGLPNTSSLNIDSTTNIELIKSQANIRTSTLESSRQVQHLNKVITRQLSSYSPVLQKTPSSQKTEIGSNSDRSNHTPAITRTSVIGNYTNSLPFETFVKNESKTPTCPDLITPQMHTKFNFSVLSRMGCNPTFSYN